MNQFVDEYPCGTHATSDTHTCAQDALVASLEFRQPSDDLSNPSWRFCQRVFFPRTSNLLIPTGCEMAMAPPLQKKKSDRVYVVGLEDSLWINLVHGNTQFLNAVCELRSKGLIDLPWVSLVHSSAQIRQTS